MAMGSTSRWQQGCVCAHSAVARAGLSSLNKGQAIEYEVGEDRDKSSVENFNVARSELNRCRRINCPRASAAKPTSGPACNACRELAVTTVRQTGHRLFGGVAVCLGYSVNFPSEFQAAGERALPFCSVWMKRGQFQAPVHTPNSQ